MIEVHFEDASKKKFAWSEETTVAELLQKIEQKMHIKSDFDSFALYTSFVQDGYQYGLFILYKCASLILLFFDFSCIY